jgi:hypothetical protein
MASLAILGSNLKPASAICRSLSCRNASITPPSAIAILDEAQFLGRRVRVTQIERASDITMRLSLNPDAAPEIALANAQALALLDGLGIDRRVTGMVTMTELRQRLTTPRIRLRLDAYPDGQLR